MTALEVFQTRREELYSKLDDALHSVSYTAHLMEIDPSDRTIADYESALDKAAEIRKAIGENADAEDAYRSDRAGIAPIKKTEQDENKGRSFDLASILEKQRKAALGL